jgi:hypothetical protein
MDRILVSLRRINASRFREKGRILPGSAVQGLFTRPPLDHGVAGPARGRLPSAAYDAGSCRLACRESHRRGRMGIVERVCAIVLVTIAAALAPARAQQEPARPVRAEEIARPARTDEGVRPPRPDELARPARVGDAAGARACLNQKERRALVEGGAVMHLAAALHAVRTHVQGTLVRARLCRRGAGLAYVLTVLGHDGKVTRVVVDAVKGTLVGER